MADGTRARMVDERLARHDEALTEVLANQQLEIRNTHTGIQETLELILDRLTTLERVPNRAHGEHQQGDGILPNPAQEQRPNRLQMVPIPHPKGELPSFEGYKPKVWLRKCERYFNLYRTQEHQKVEAAALYLNGLAETWYQSLVLSRGLVNWVDFKDELISRFEDELLDDIVEQFNRFVQTGSVDEFLGKFENLKAQMLVRNPHLNDAHFLYSFMGALKEEIRFAVKMFKPTTLKLAIEKARMQEKAIEAVQRRNKVTTATTMGQNSLPKALESSTSRPDAFKLSPEVYEYRKSNRLCFQCGDKYTVGHQCRPKQLNCLMGEVETTGGVSAEVDDPSYTDLSIEGEIK
ncbi:hypothetical protein KY290_012090 [Solanum tuberosum]|uniref:Retrotransposon gag domain-containing protein n=1 Tax=Solanum tuberosum TaxID=4113 RepID=A0ABQ7W2H6_SOLTU|nr:hypothetical protein KY289_010338 [Solanum tuberosum]KAH0710750.1 hypothetical protein KY284_012177 [Solanum tuberosum]KAH0774953.1 hypothetical protein KY290_012090 [Solanum tuberosum]